MVPTTARAMLLLSLVFVCLGGGFWAHAAWLSRRAPASATPSPIITADALQAAFVSVAERVRPAVVHIGTVQVAKGQRPEMGPGPSPDPFFKEKYRAAMASPSVFLCSSASSPLLLDPRIRGMAGPSASSRSELEAASPAPRSMEMRWVAFDAVSLFPLAADRRAKPRS